MLYNMSMAEKDRARGMLVGLAVGDALGAPIEFLPSPSDVYIADMGDKIAYFHENYRMPKGAWTDDTSMALCLADSLLECGGYDSYDIMDRYARWVNEGYRSYDGRPADDVGNQTLLAIEDYLKYPELSLEDTRTERAGNGAIMRLAPVVIARHNSDLDSVLKMAEYSCLETHNSLEVIKTARKFATCLYLALHGAKKSEILDVEKDEKILKVVESSDDYILRDLGGYVVDTYMISLWGLANFDNFYDGMMAVLRLGGDTDTNGACYGQLAGAYYGYSNIPEEWRDNVLLASELVEISDRLYGMRECPVIKTRFCK